MKKILTILTLCLIMVNLTLPVFGQNNDIYVISTSDMHGNIFKNEAKKTVGYGNVLSVKKIVPEGLIADGGDFLGDISQKNTQLNENIVYAMNKAGYEYAMFGENEAKYGYDEFKEIVKNANFEILGANITYNKKRVFKEEKIKEKNGIKIGIFGVSEKIEGTGYEYEDPISASYKCVRNLKDMGATVIVGIVYSHDDTLAQKIAKDSRDITIIVESGTHTEREKGSLEGKTLITNTGANGNAINVSKIVLNDGSLASFETSNYDLDSIKASYPGENELEIKMKDAEEKIRENETKIIGKISEPLEFSTEIYYSSTKLGNFISDIIKEKTKADVVILSSANFNGGFEKEVTKNQINNLFSDNNTVSVRKISGESLYKVMEIAVNKIEADKNGNIKGENSVSDKFLQVSGIKVKYNPGNETGKKVISLYVGDKKVTWLNDKDEYTIAATEDVFEETNQYLSELEVKEKFSDVTEIVEEYLKSESKSIKISDEKRVDTTTEQKSYWWVIGIVAAGFFLVIIIVFVIAKIIIYFA